MQLTEEQYKERCAEILRDNITFSGQLGDYVIHGALEMLWKLHINQEGLMDEIINEAKASYKPGTCSSYKEAYDAGVDALAKFITN